MTRLIPLLLLAVWLGGTLRVDAGLMIGDEMDQIFELDPGESVDGSVRLYNSSKERELTVKIYQTDYHFTADGRNSFPDPGTLARSNAKWVDVHPARMTLKPETDDRFRFTIRVPADAKPGTYWSLIMLESLNPRSAEHPDANLDDDTLRIGATQRQAIQIVTTVSGDSDIQIKLLDKRLATTKKGRFFFLALGNTGTLWARPEVWIELFNADGESAGRFTAPSTKRIYPTCSVHHVIPLKDLPAGDYSAIVVVDCGEEAFTTQHEIRIDP